MIVEKINCAGARMTPTTLTPTDVRDLALQSVKDHIEDVYSQLPVDPAHMTPETLAATSRAYGRLGKAISRLWEAQERVDRCQCQDRATHQSSADAAAAALASPSLRERLGRAPLASEGALP